MKRELRWERRSHQQVCRRNPRPFDHPAGIEESKPSICKRYRNRDKNPKPKPSQKSPREIDGSASFTKMINCKTK
ncbi:hypothetical protein EUTSA_v10001225mg [Eutrema salsugineum]|uniref:Uncharacterized protein n=1 Tax=Eutrema salsugineum TaxID=72664 RepID=V4L8A3_EUTSA|nr:hypothetical protein EUTSA_v10001225mg [Eutrema salsugineum]